MASFSASSKGSSQRSAGSDMRSRSGGQSRASGSRSALGSGATSRPASEVKLCGTPRVSDRLNPKTIDPFNTSKNKSAFAGLYANGAVPCRLVHGSVRHKLTWNSPQHEIHFDPVLVYLSQGLVESVHPYAFIARQGFRELLELEHSADKVTPLLNRIAPNIRAALSHKNPDVFDSGISSLLLLSSVVGPHLNPHLKVLLVPIAKRGMEKQFRERVHDILMQLELGGGKEALLIIKTKVPTYTSVVK